MFAGRRKIAIAFGLLLLTLLALAKVFLTSRLSDKQWPAGSDEERLARALAVLDRQRNTNFIEDAFDFLGVELHREDSQPSLTVLAREIADRDGAQAIPLLIGVIDADNSYETTYNVGYHVLRGLTKVEHTAFHDGAWWRRWWDVHRRDFPAALQDRPIPEFDKTAYGRNWVPFSADIDTLAGKLRLVPEAIERDKQYWQGTIKSLPFGLQDLAAEIAAHGDPRAIPYLIPLLDANPSARGHVRQALRTLTGADDRAIVETDNEKGEFRDPQTGKTYTDRFQPVWWREWWAVHRSEFPTAAEIDIPDYSQPLVLNWQEDAEPATKAE